MSFLKPSIAAIGISAWSMSVQLELVCELIFSMLGTVGV